jgi:hypothetical protein
MEKRKLKNHYTLLVGSKNRDDFLKKIGSLLTLVHLVHTYLTKESSDPIVKPAPYIECTYSRLLTKIEIVVVLLTSTILLGMGKDR